MLRHRLRIILFAAFAAMLSILFVMPAVRGKQCRRIGALLDRTTMRCVTVTPVRR